MALRKGQEKYGGSTDESADYTSSIEGSPVLQSRTRKSVVIQRHKHYEQHHHHHHHLHSHRTSDVNNHQLHHQQDQNWLSTEHNAEPRHFRAISHNAAKGKSSNQHQSVYSEYSRENAKSQSSAHHQQAYSDYSSGNDEFDTQEEVKTDYTYARSASYNTRVTPTRPCPSPNMSRSRLRRNSTSYHSHYSSDDSMEVEENAFLKSKSQLRTSTPYPLSYGKKTFTSLHTEFGEQVSYLTDHTSHNVLTETITSLSSSISVISQTVYKFICFMTSLDTFLLSRCCSWRGKNLLLFLLLLLPLLLLPLLLPGYSYMSQILSTDFLSSLFPTKSAASLLEGSEQAFDKLGVSREQMLASKWKDEMEKRLNEVFEQRWGEQAKLMEMRWNQQMQHMEKLQGALLDKVSEIDFKAIRDEISDLKTKVEFQLREEDLAKSAATDDLKVILERLRQLEERQKVLEGLLVDLENCCKKQGVLPAGVSQAELAIQLSALAHEVRANLSQLVLMQSTAASSSNHHEDVMFVHKSNSSHGILTLIDIEKIVKTALNRYDADKTGLVDYALESAGGSVVSTRCTESYPLGTAQFSLFGVPFWYSANTPRTVIQPQVHPGECWAMRGTQGYLVIQLSASIRPTAFSLEHIPRELSPTGKIDSAPKEFSVFGLTSETDTDGQLLGNFHYVDDGEPLQKFNVQNKETGVFSIIELRVHSNHGNPEYTCLYRFRVHGIRQ